MGFALDSHGARGGCSWHGLKGGLPGAVGGGLGFYFLVGKLQGDALAWGCCAPDVDGLFALQHHVGGYNGRCRQLGISLGCLHHEECHYGYEPESVAD